MDIYHDLNANAKAKTSALYYDVGNYKEDDQIDYTNAGITEYDLQIAKDIHSLHFKSIKTGVIMNTWLDWHLVPTERPVFEMPTLKKYSQDIPGGNGEIDLTEALGGYPVYQNRTGSIEFALMHQSLVTNLGYNNGYDNASRTEWQIVYSSIANFLHGQKVRVFSDDIPDYFFEGRVTISSWGSDEQYSKITLDYDLEPYMYTVIASDDPWKWDPFNFYTGIIRSYGANTIKYGTTDTSFQVLGTIIPVIPTVTATQPSILTVDGQSFTLAKDTAFWDPRIVIKDQSETTTFTFRTTNGSTDGSASIHFRGRSL